MKKLIALFALTASVWSSFSFASNQHITYIQVKSGTSSQTGYYTIDPLTFVSPSGVDPCLYFQEIGTLKNIPWDTNITHFDPSFPCKFKVKGTESNYSNYMSMTYTSTTAEPTQTCKSAEGAFIDGYHNAIDDFCAHIGTTGGTAPEPLMCIATNVAETPANSGNFQHTVTATKCSSPTGPTAPDGEQPCTENCEPPPCTENCEPPTEPVDPIPDSSGGSTSTTTTTTGTQTDSAGNVTNINTQTVTDFSPVTTRQDETNDRLEVENQNSAAANTKLDAIGQGLVDTNANLEGIKAAINGQNLTVDMSGVESKLAEISNKMGTVAEGEAAGNNAELPDFDAAISEGMTQIHDQINTAENNHRTAGMENIGDRMTSFDSIPQLFQFASDNCAPLPFGDKQLDICSYSATVRNILTWVLTMMTIIFLVVSLNSDIKNIRMS